MNFRTDLAVETAVNCRLGQEDVVQQTEKRGRLTLHRTRILTPRGAAAVGKPKGRYITACLPPLTDDERDIMAHFQNPAMPSVSVTADAAMKIASARPGFASTDVFTEMIGFDQADIRRIKAQEQRARGLAVLEEVNADNE